MRNLEGRWNLCLSSNKPFCHVPAQKISSMTSINVSKVASVLVLHRQKQNPKLINLVLRTFPIIFRSIVPTAADDSSSIYLLTVLTENLGRTGQYARILAESSIARSRALHLLTLSLSHFSLSFALFYIQARTAHLLSACSQCRQIT